jgi:hypothetical protein
MRELSQISAAWLLGTGSAQIRDFNFPAGEDNPRNLDETYDARKLVAWFVSYGGKNNSRQQSLVDSDGEISDAARKFRSEANILEMKEQLMAGDLVKAHDVRSYMSRIADAIRTLGEDLGRSPMPIAGADVQQRINDMIESVEWDLT